MLIWSSFKILKNLKSNLKPKNMLFFLARLSRNSKLNMRLPIKYLLNYRSSTIMHCLVRFKLCRRYLFYS